MKKIKAFTLIELLVVILIISLIISFTLPKYIDYKKTAYDLQAKNDLKNIATAIEANYIEKEEYLSCSNQNCEAISGVGKLSKHTQIDITANDFGFIGISKSIKGTGTEFKWDSENGGFILDNF